MSILKKTFKKILNISTLGLLGKTKKPEDPEVEKVVPLIDTDSEEVRMARKKATAKRLRGSGRSNTILSQGGGTGFGG